MITAPTGLTQAAVDRAEVMVALSIGLSTLETENHLETGTLKSSSIISLTRPASQLGTVEVAGLDFSDFAQVQAHFAVRLPYPVCGSYEVTYRSGWDDVESIPAAIRQAVIIAAEAGGALAGVPLPEGVTSIRLPELSVQFAGAGHQAGVLPDIVQQLLRPWRRLTW